jgi:hypothetical protein
MHKHLVKVRSETNLFLLFLLTEQDANDDVLGIVKKKKQKIELSLLLFSLSTAFVDYLLVIPLYEQLNYTREFLPRLY